MSWSGWCQRVVSEKHIKACWIVAITENEGNMGVGCWGKCERDSNDREKFNSQDAAPLTDEEQFLAKSLYKAMKKPETFQASGLHFRGQKFQFLTGTPEDVSFFTKGKGGYIALVCTAPECVWLAQLEDDSEPRVGMGDLDRVVKLLTSSMNKC